MNKNNGFKNKPNHNNRSKKTSWGEVSNWYEKVVENSDSYQQKVILPNFLRVIDPQKSERILDIACGEGIFAREVSKLGARVFGLDISKELISLAREKSKDINYEVGIADKSLPYSSTYFDKVYCILALQNIKDLGVLYKEASRVLKDKGKFVAVINHPMFRVPKESDWGFDENSKRQYRKIFSYMSEKTIPIDMNPGKNNSKNTLSFHRPLQFYIKNFAKNGFVVTRVEEWISHKESQKGPRQIAEDSARKEIPMFMMIEVMKL